ncbi:amidohydrolase family protein [Fodinicurvata sp. EGI_FJ10296]|uniref:amidohydrolase family protein n=1 Tax=Fodinicurvata sp. EGI_FJ10296 TaxID=3231908 RepID=UPI003451E022
MSDRKPAASIPQGGWDCHCHLFGPLTEYPAAESATHTAPTATVADYRSLLDRLGLAKGVVVTSTVYGTDNRLLIESLQAAGDWLRGVAVIDNSVTDAELDIMHRAGVRAFRINLIYRSRGEQFRGGVGHEALRPLAERTAALGWHAQLWCDSSDLPELRAELGALPLPCVIDHFGRTPTKRGIDDPGFETLRAMLAEGEAYAKISGAYRISDEYPRYGDVKPFAQALISAAPDRLVWGTDWPHPNCKSSMPDDADLLEILAEWCDGDQALLRKILVETPQKLYG